MSAGTRGHETAGANQNSNVSAQDPEVLGGTFHPGGTAVRTTLTNGRHRSP